ncbi:MAG TPA: ATP-binding protein [Candidatus Paceibacterota bacterium]
MIFKRKIEAMILERLFKGRAILIFGPRQAGKTTLCKELILPFGNKAEYFNCELASVRKSFILGEPDVLLELVGDKKIVVFDEAQTIENIGVILKVFVDTYPKVQIIATGSSSFDLANKINEPLTGRAFEFTLYPLSLEEITQAGKVDKIALLELLRLGTYPAVVGEPDITQKEDLLKNLATNYLYKDIFIFESVRSPAVLENLVKAIALQVGSMVSLNELAQTVGASRETVQKYLSFLEQAYVIFRLPSFSRNPRNELKKAFKIFFVDVGIRNAIIDNLSSLNKRLDKGFVFENFCIAERLKESVSGTQSSALSFWRTRKGEEIDLIEERAGEIRATEYKWGNEDVSFAKFLNKYPDAITEVINLDSVALA